jgi:hypothetical protein
VDHGEEVSAEFFEACCESSHVFHGAEETLDDVAHFVETGVMGDGFSGVALRWNDCQSPFIGYELADGVRAVSLVGDDGTRYSGAIEKIRQDLGVMDLAAGDDKAPGTAVFIDYGVNFACAAAA